MNNSGPRIEPWGTPEVTLEGVDDAPSRTIKLVDIGLVDIRLVDIRTIRLVDIAAYCSRRSSRAISPNIYKAVGIYKISLYGFSLGTSN